MVGTPYITCARTPPERYFGEGGCTGPATAGFTFVDSVGTVPQTLNIDFSLAWGCGSPGTHTIRLNSIAIGSIATTSEACICSYGSSVRTLTVNNPGSFVTNGTNTITIDSVPGSGCYSIGANPGWGNAFAQVTLTY